MFLKTFHIVITIKTRIRMKESKYNYFAKEDNQVICLNGISGHVFSISHEAHQEIKKILANPNDPNNDTDIVQSLYDLKFIIDDDVNEMEILRSRNREAVRNQSYQLIINPTLECNFRCWYCYENHKEGHMNEVTIENIKKFIVQTLEREDITIFHLGWFGGEPLLYFYEIMYPIACFAQNKAKELGKKFEHSMTSNGFRLTKDVIEKCTETHLSTIQVTLDGNRELHNKTRNQNGSPSFDIILNNIINYCKNHKDNKIILRVNYTNEVIKVGMKEVFESIPSEVRSQIEISFHRVWQTVGMEKSKNDVTNNLKYIDNMNFAISRNTPFERYKGMVCYADSENYANINYDGSVYRCTAEDYKKENRLGYLNEEGVIVWEKEELMKQVNESSTFENPICLKCKNLAICGGLCYKRKVNFIRTHKHSCAKSDLDTNVDDFIKEYYQTRIKKRQSIHHKQS